MVTTRQKGREVAAGGLPRLRSSKGKNKANGPYPNRRKLPPPTPAASLTLLHTRADKHRNAVTKQILGDKTRSRIYLPAGASDEQIHSRLIALASPQSTLCSIAIYWADRRALKASQRAGVVKNRDPKFQGVFSSIFDGPAKGGLRLALVTALSFLWTGTLWSHERPKKSGTREDPTEIDSGPVEAAERLCQICEGWEDGIGYREEDRPGDIGMPSSQNHGSIATPSGDDIEERDEEGEPTGPEATDVADEGSAERQATQRDDQQAGPRAGVSAAPGDTALALAPSTRGRGGLKSPNEGAWVGHAWIMIILDNETTVPRAGKTILIWDSNADRWRAHLKRLGKPFTVYTALLSIQQRFVKFILAKKYKITRLLRGGYGNVDLGCCLGLAEAFLMRVKERSEAGYRLDTSGFLARERFIQLPVPTC